MEFKMKTEAELLSLTPEQRDQYAVEKSKYEQYLVDEKIKAATKDFEEKIKGLEAKGAEYEKMKKDLLAEIEKIKQDAQSTNESAMFKSFKENLSAIRDIVKGKSTDEVILKADTLTSSISGSTHAAVDGTIARIGTKVPSLYNLLPKIPMQPGSGGAYRWTDWDETTTARAAAAVAEGATFPESEAKFVERVLDLVKIGDSLPVSEEFGEDETQAFAELSLFLETNVEAAIGNAIINSNGAGGTIKGLLASVPVFTAPNLSIPAPNLRDLLWKTRIDITKTEGSIFQPSHVVMSSSLFELYVNEKDSQNRYLFDEDKSTIAGLSVLLDDNMPDNQLVVGDMRFATIIEMPGATISADYNGMFNKDMKLLKARKRLLFLIKNRNSFGFRKITDVAAALALLAAP